MQRPAREVFVHRSPMPTDAQRLYAWHAEPGAFARLVPPWESVRLLHDAAALRDGETVSFRLGRWPLTIVWVARIEAVVPGESFRDVQVRGPFALWEHTHTMLPDGPGRSFLEDRVEYVLPLGLLGHVFGGGLARRRLERTFTYRHRVTAAALSAPARPATAPAREGL